jgi:hypothetical protein
MSSPRSIDGGQESAPNLPRMPLLHLYQRSCTQGTGWAQMYPNLSRPPPNALSHPTPLFGLPLSHPTALLDTPLSHPTSSSAFPSHTPPPFWPSSLTSHRLFGVPLAHPETLAAINNRWRAPGNEGLRPKPTRLAATRHAPESRPFRPAACQCSGRSCQGWVEADGRALRQAERAGLA